MNRCGVAGLCIGLIVSACGGEAATSTTNSPVTTAATTTIGTTTTTSGFVVTSEDGDLIVAVSSAAMAEDPGITIRLLAPEEFPPELAGAADDPDVRIYNLEPEGLEFDAPVTVTRRLDTARFEDLGPNEVPVMVLVTRNPGGGYELYSDLAVVRRGDDVFVSGTTTHFSPAIAIRESPTVTVNLSQEQLESVPSARSLQGILTLLTEAPGTIAVSASLRDRQGASLTGSGSFALIDGVAATPTATGLDIQCVDVGAIDVLPITYTAEFGSSPAPGQAGFTTVTSLNLFPPRTRVMLTVDAILQCHAPATSILAVLVPLEVVTDHPGGTMWIPNQDFRGGLSGALVRTGEVPRLDGVWGGLIRDNDGNGMIDATDTMFDAYPFDEIDEMYSYVSPLYEFGSYFVYLVDALQYSSVPSGTDWTLGAGLAAYQETYVGSGRFESSIGYVGLGGVPFVYTVGPSEEPQSAPDARIEMFDILRVQF